MIQQKLSKNSDGLGKPWIILIVVLSILVVGGIGFLIGKNMAESDAKAKYDQQVKSLQDDLDKAKSTVSTGAEQGQQTLESLQDENTELKSKIKEQEEQISDLEQQLEAAKKSSSQSQSR